MRLALQHLTRSESKHDTNVIYLIEVGEARCLLQNHGEEDHNY
jgi:hypothetical protein